ncbi:INO1_1 [Sanghuangporus weigelae]
MGGKALLLGEAILRTEARTRAEYLTSREAHYSDKNLKEVGSQDEHNIMIKYLEGEMTKCCKDPDQIAVIKYVIAIGEFNRTIDEYYSEILCGGSSTISIFNECEIRFSFPFLRFSSTDSTRLGLASGDASILDLSILGELLTRAKYRDVKTRKHSEFQPLYPVLSLLSFMLQAPPHRSSNLGSADLILDTLW